MNYVKAWLSKVVILTYIQRDTAEIIYHVRRFTVDHSGAHKQTIT